MKPVFSVSLAIFAERERFDKRRLGGKAAQMKLRHALCSSVAASLFHLGTLGVASAQSPAASATAIPPSKPAAEAATPSPGAAVNTSTPAEKTTGGKKQISAEEKTARKTKRLEKYDKNHDGKLDAAEKAAMRDDRAKEKTSTDKASASPTP